MDRRPRGHQALVLKRLPNERKHREEGAGFVPSRQQQVGELGELGKARGEPEGVVAHVCDEFVLAVARVAGIMAAKRTAELIPLCHPLPLTRVAIDLAVDETGVTATATAATAGKTGVEMEALTAISVTLLTIYDMAKAIDKGMTIGGVQLLTKTGGKSGDWAR